MSFRTATTRRAVAIAVLATALLVVGAASAWARPASTTVRFHGYRLTVPSSWPVFDLSRAPSTCVRFDRHALYLGVPGSDQRCPAHAVGRGSAILVTPLSAGAAVSGARGAILRGVRSEGSAASYVVPSAGVQVTATWNGDRRLMARILRRRLARKSTAASRSGRSRLSVEPALRTAAAGPRAFPAQTTYAGRGFDACSTPSSSAMSAWSSSPYRGIGVYIGGINAACSQPNLTAGWVTRQVGAGWHLIPTYVGLQGVGSCSGTCATITPSQASSQGTAAANDAVSQAQALGIPGGNPIYDDMEQYTQSSANTRAVLAFLSGWTTRLHAAGYLSGVYSSASSAITDLVNAYGTSYTEPDDIWVADWNGEKTTSDPYVPRSDWAGQRRLHQYSGAHNETYGSVTINIDGDYLNGATADTASPIPDGTFVEVSGQSAAYRIAGGAPLYVSSFSQFGGPQPVSRISPRQFAALRPYPIDGTLLTTTSGNVYRIVGGAPFAVTNSALFGSQPPSVMVDQWDLSNLTDPRSHLRSAPLDGTVVEGLPSDSYWAFSGGYRSSVAPTAAAVTVDDNGLAPFAQGASTGGVGSGRTTTHAAVVKCVVPQLKHMSLPQARSALTRARCRLGTVHRPPHWGRHHVLRVFGQSVAPHSRRDSQYPVSIRLL